MIIYYDIRLKYTNIYNLNEEATQQVDCKCSILEHFVPIKTV